MSVRGEYALYGPKTWEDTLKEIIRKIPTENSFEIKLLIMEGLNNAYLHGNKGDDSKPIFLNYSLIERKITIEIEDCGLGPEQVDIPREICMNNLLDETGRGLYIIQSIADDVEFFKGKIIMKKQLI